MQPYSIAFGRAVLTITAVALCWALHAPVAMASAGTSGDAPQRRIFIDPDTGKVVEPGADAAHPQHDPRHDESQQPRAPEQGEDRREQGAQAWTTDDGVQMLAPAPGDAPKTGIVRCPDGSLHMGADVARHGESERAALCDAAPEDGPDE